MTEDELIARFNKFEWNDVEFKKAQRGVDDAAYSRRRFCVREYRGRLSRIRRRGYPEMEPLIVMRVEGGDA